MILNNTPYSQQSIENVAKIMEKVAAKAPPNQPIWHILAIWHLDIVADLANRNSLNASAPGKYDGDSRIIQPN